MQEEERHKALLLLKLENRDREAEWSDNLEAHLLEVSEPVYDGKPWGIASILSRQGQPTRINDTQELMKER